MALEVTEGLNGNVSVYQLAYTSHITFHEVVIITIHISFVVAMIAMLIDRGMIMRKENEKKQEQVSNGGMGWVNKHPVTPDAGAWKSINFKGGGSYKVEPPPDNNSEKTKKELEELKKLTANLTENEITYIKKWAITTSANTLWLEKAEELIGKYGLMGAEGARVHAVLNGAIYTGSTATFQAKYQYLRPRPTDLDPTIQLPEGMSVPVHPSYPSGHSTTAWVSAYILSYFFPNERNELEELAASVALTREQMGIHFKSDNEASKKLAQDIANDIIEQLKNDRAPANYTKVNASGNVGH